MREWIRRGAWLALAGQLGCLAPVVRAAEEAEGTAEETEAAEPPPLRLALPEDPGPPVLGYVVAGVGLAGGITLASVLKSEADEAYRRYLLTADPATAQGHLDDAERYDRLSLIGWVVAQASFVAFLLLLIRKRDRPLIPVEGEPVVRATGDGVQVGWRIGP